MRLIAGTTMFEIRQKTAVAIGKFDGIHRGHLELLSHILKAKQRGLTSAVFTFDTSPEVFFQKNTSGELMVKEEKRRFFQQLGIDLVIEYPFDDKSAKISPEDYVKKVLLERMNAHLVVAGEDLSFGYRGAGDAALLNRLAREYHFETEIIPKIRENGRQISSTYVREEVLKGDMESAWKLLGRPYEVSGIVCKGNQIGRSIGFPTLNLYPPKEKLLPPNGVYFSKVSIEGSMYEGVTNIGRKPTIGEKQPFSVETHLFDYEKDAYGKFCEIKLLKFDRKEQRFEDLEQLKEAIWQNVFRARQYFDVTTY